MRVDRINLCVNCVSIFPCDYHISLTSTFAMFTPTNPISHPYQHKMKCVLEWIGGNFGLALSSHIKIDWQIAKVFFCHYSFRYWTV